MKGFKFLKKEFVLKKSQNFDDFMELSAMASSFYVLRVNLQY